VEIEERGKERRHGKVLLIENGRVRLRRTLTLAPAREGETRSNPDISRTLTHRSVDGRGQRFGRAFGVPPGTSPHPSGARFGGPANVPRTRLTAPDVTTVAERGAGQSPTEHVGEVFRRTKASALGDIGNRKIRFHEELRGPLEVQLPNLFGR
jgi:hypothetical protein